MSERNGLIILRILRLQQGEIRVQIAAIDQL